ncbi:unnamed protein product [Adineta ricciae]|uniref:Uncharacterized protein n=1 Tax=Adineta ricciae TaxID=249248 RepID=A0A815AXV2_ADIRI|nr:unnamed protein product [Adineta ricciae]CAF1263456.1 unnamed protein product [Adineta ricciae]
MGVFDHLTRTRLYLIGYVFLGLLSLSLLITVIVQGHKSKSKSNDSTIPSTDACLTDGCISAATYQLRSMDSSLASNLCSDFYKYACGGWERTHPIQSYEVERTILGDILDRRDAEIERLLNSPIVQVGDHSWEYKVKTYYSECLDDYARLPDSSKYMIGLLQDNDTIDGWFLIDNSAPDVSQQFLLKNQSLYQQLSHIHGDFGVLAVFGIRTRFDETDSSVKRLEFFPAGLSMEINDYLGTDVVSESRRAAFQLYIIQICGLFARDANIKDENLSDRTYTIANDVYTIERYLAEILQRNPSSGKPYITTLHDMNIEFMFDFHKLMGHELADPNAISVLTPIYVTNRMYFKEAFDYLGKYDDPLFARMIHNYLRWRLIWTYIDDLSYDYIHAHRVYIDAYYGYALHTTNEAYCSREVIRRFPLAIQRLYLMNSTQAAGATTTAETIFTALKNGLLTYVNERATWMADEPTKTVAREKINRLTAAIGYTKIVSTDESLNSYYDTFIVSDDSHFMNAINYHRFHRWTLSASLADPMILDHWDLFESRTSRLFDYIAVFNQLFVIASGLREPLIDSQWPMSVNMGSIGVLLAQKLFASIDGPEGRAHLANGTRYDWWQSPTIDGYNKSRTCITNYYVNDVKSVSYNINGAQIQVRLAGEPFSPTTLRHIGALRFAYNALMKTDSIKLPGTNHTSAQTFFLAYAQTQCYQRQELLQLVRTQLGIYDERIALNAALFHMPEFTNAFQCPARPEQCFD